MANTEQTRKRPITPLWIIALFVSLTETVLGVAVVQTSGAIQMALTAFVVAFPLLIAGAFFTILWNRPYVLYPPTEYGSKTDVASYVQAMQRRVFDENTLYSNIQKSIQGTLISDEVIGELSRTLSSQVTENTETQIGQVLNSAVGRTVEQIRKANFLTIDSQPLLGSRDGKVWQVAYEKCIYVANLLDDIWASLYPHVPAYSYGSQWALRDSSTGRIFNDLEVNFYGVQTCTQTLKEVGFRPGMKLEIVSL